jgi:predicted AAA+ superfamily ATPase
MCVIIDLQVKNRNNINKIKYRYFKSPNKVFDAGVNPAVGFLYFYFLSLPEEFNPSVFHLSKKLKIDRKTVYKYLLVLINRNMIKVIREASKGQVALYELINPSLWN